LWHNDKQIPVDLKEENQYSSADWYVDKAIEWISANKDTSFFAYVPTQLPHLYMPYEPMGIYKDKPWPEGDKRWATMIHMIDVHLGKIMDAVDSLGIADNTIILFMSDNGGGDGQRHFYHNARFFKSNANFRGMKRDLYEGGIRVPFIVKWSAVIQTLQVSNEPVVYYDLLATCAELSGQSVKSDGESLVKLFTGESDTLEREYIYWEFPYMNIPNAKFAVRKGKWKAVKEYEKEQLQIYNLEEDPSEIYNWVKEMPELEAEFEAIIKKEHVPSEYWPLRSERE
jgi:arylsulfatase A-like enzyme